MIPSCITARAWRTCPDVCRDRSPAVAGKTFPTFPAHAQPTVLHTCQEAHETYNPFKQYGGIDLVHKSHNAPMPYPTVHHFVTEMGTEGCLCLSNTLWDSWDGSMSLPDCSFWNDRFAKTQSLLTGLRKSHSRNSSVLRRGFNYTLPGIILCLRLANERRRYTVTPSLIGWAHTQNDPWIVVQGESHEDEMTYDMNKSSHGWHAPLFFQTGSVGSMDQRSHRKTLCCLQSRNFLTWWKGHATQHPHPTPYHPPPLPPTPYHPPPTRPPPHPHPHPTPTPPLTHIM